MTDIQKAEQLNACQRAKFCKDFVAMKNEQLHCNGCTLSGYTLGNLSIYQNQSIFGTLITPEPNQDRAAELYLDLKFYQDGIMQATIRLKDEPDRFTISSTGVGVEWSQLKQIINLASHVTYQSGKALVSVTSDDGKDQFIYEL